MSEQRIERFMLVRHRMAVRAFCFATVGELRDSWPDGDYVRLVEIREGEPHPDKVREITDELQVQAIDASNRLEKAERELKAAIERAEKAEVIVRARDAEIEVLRAFLKQFEDGGMSGREVREAKADERARYERETAARLLAGPCSTIEAAMSKARQLADACFGAKEAKG